MPDMGHFRFVDSLNPSAEPDATDPNPDVRRRYLGKYRGTVVQNNDPQGQGRLQVQVASVAGLIPSTWALPCVPVAHLTSGVFVRPPIGAGVWVEFEQGDLNHPIWVGGFWSTPWTVPTAAQVGQVTPSPTPILTIETTTSGLSISDVPLGMFGNVCLRSGPSTIVMTPAGIQITAPQVGISTPLFSVNGLALTVTGP